MKINRRSNRCKTWLHHHPGTVKVLLRIQKRRGHPFRHGDVCDLHGYSAYDQYIVNAKHQFIFDRMMKVRDAYGKIMMERIIEPEMAKFVASMPPPFIPTQQQTTI